MAYCLTSYNWCDGANEQIGLALFRQPSDDRVRFADGAAFVAESVQGFVGDFGPKLLQRRRRRFVRVPLGVVRSPRHFTAPIDGWHMGLGTGPGFYISC